MDNFNFSNAHERIFSPLEAYRFGLAVGSSLKENSKVTVGYCRSRGSDIYAFLISSAITACKNDCFIVPESEEFMSEYAAYKLHAEQCIQICSGSHISVSAKGALGSGLSADFLNEVTARYHSNDYKRVKPAQSGKIKIVNDIPVLYELDLLHKFESIKNIRASVKTASPLVAKLFDEVIRDKNDLGAEEIVFNFSLDCKKVSAYSERSGYVFYETLLLIAAKIELEKGVEVEVPKYFPQAADILSGRLIRAKDRESLKINANNRFLTDSFYLITMILDYLGKNKLSLSEALEDVPSVYFTERYIYTGERSEDKMNKLLKSKFLNENQERVSSIGKARVKLDKGKKGLNLFADALSFEAASSICDEIEGYVSRINLDKEE
ncbi:MAG: hypothetical protein LUC25_01610 [Ruminococcus sp.]|nr:hypothetical protein [Ruminococcus sp.]